MDTVSPLVFIYFGVGVFVAWYCVWDDIKNYHILKFDLHGVMTVIVLGILWPLTVWRLKNE